MSTSTEFDAWVEKARSVPIASIAPQGLKRQGKEMVGPCPRCGGTDRFSINPAEGLFNCRKCEKGGDVIALGEFIWGRDFNTTIEELTGQPAPKKLNGATAPWQTEGEWIYRDADERPYLKVVRKRKPDGIKIYPQYHQQDGKWIPGKPAGPKIPYLLPELLDSDRSEPVWIFEGEKCVDRARREGLQATCASEGAAKWTSELNEHFRGRIVWISPDADEPGLRHGRLVAANLHGVAREVRIIEIPISSDGRNVEIKVLPDGRKFEIPCIADGQDVYDFLENGGTGDDLLRLGELTPIWQPPQNDEGISQGPEGLRENSQPNGPNAEGRLILTVTEFLDGFVSPDYVVDGLWKRGFFYSLTAMTGGGKTAIALTVAELASNRKRRRKLGSHEVEHVRVVYIACENADDVRGRLIGMEARMDFDRADLDMLVIDKVFDLEKNMERITKEVEAFGGNIGLAIIDTSAAMFQGDDENSNPQMIGHAKTQRRLCDLPGRPCVLALNHPTKSVASPELLLPRGGGGYLNETDGNFTARAHGDRLTTLHWAGKLRGPDFDPIEFRLPIVTTTKLTDAKGRLMPTVMAEVVTDAQVEETEQRATFQENRLLAAISANPDGSLAEWAHGCGWTLQGKPGEPPVPNKSLVRRVIARLQKNKLVSKDGRGFTLTKAGKKTAGTS